MFSIFHGLFTLAALGIDDYNKSTQDAENRARARQSGSLTYYGSRGNEYLVENNKWVSTKRNSQGEDVIADMKTGQVYYNLTKERKKTEEQRCIAKGKTVRDKMYNECNHAFYGKYQQMYHQVDIATGIPVATVNINTIDFYIQLDNALILRPADNANIKKFIPSCTIDEAIQIINQRQEKLKKEIDVESYFDVSYKLFYNMHWIYIDKAREVHICSLNNLRPMQQLYRKDGFDYNREEERWM